MEATTCTDCTSDIPVSSSAVVEPTSQSFIPEPILFPSLTIEYCNRVGIQYIYWAILAEFVISVVGETPMRVSGW